jgi:hypothetical protein
VRDKEANSQNDLVTLYNNGTAKTANAVETMIVKN